MTAALAPYAVTQSNSRGRQFPEPPHPYRGPFERDRDRIIHSAAFRRLEGKTQVFAAGGADYYRTRLTHSIEVAQVGRTIARALDLNESLTEAICLAHDVGHSPFGHRGEQVLNDLMKDCGGFEHNRQALRIIDFLEHPYPNFAGLNLMHETRHGLAVHHSPYDRPQADEQFSGPCCLEGQIADLADRIAYNCHDLEDGIRARLIEEDRAKEITLFRTAQDQIRAREIDDLVIRRTRTVKVILDNLVSQTIETSRQAIRQADIQSLEQVYASPQALIALSAQTNGQLSELESFLMGTLYTHPSLRETDRKVEQWLRRLFDGLCSNPGRMPTYFQRLAETEGLGRIICDYIAGMTDRFALSMLEDL